MSYLFAAQSQEGDGVNVLPIALVVIAIALAWYLWQRSRRD